MTDQEEIDELKRGVDLELARVERELARLAEPLRRIRRMERITLVMTGLMIVMNAFQVALLITSAWVGCFWMLLFGYFFQRNAHELRKTEQLIASGDALLNDIRR